MDKEAWRATVLGVAESDMTEQISFAIVIKEEQRFGGTNFKEVKIWWFRKSTVTPSTEEKWRHGKSKGLRGREVCKEQSMFVIWPYFTFVKHGGSITKTQYVTFLIQRIMKSMMLGQKSRLMFRFSGQFKHKVIVLLAVKWAGNIKLSWSEVKWSEVAQSCPTLCNPMDCSLPGFSIHGIFQARILEWVAISFSRGSSQPRDQTPVSRIAAVAAAKLLQACPTLCDPISGRHFTIWATREDLTSTIVQFKKKEINHLFFFYYILNILSLFWFSFAGKSVLPMLDLLCFLRLLFSLYLFLIFISFTLYYFFILISCSATIISSSLPIRSFLVVSPLISGFLTNLGLQAFFLVIFTPAIVLWGTYFR